MDIDISGHQGLKLWLNSLTCSIRAKNVDLTARQFALLLAVYLKPPPHTVRGLAARFNLSKPVISRGVDSLSALGFVKRVRDEQDRRSVFIQRTVKGAVFLTDFAEIIKMENTSQNILEETQEGK